MYLLTLILIESIHSNLASNWHLKLSNCENSDEGNLGPVGWANLESRSAGGAWKLHLLPGLMADWPEAIWLDIRYLASASSLQPVAKAAAANFVLGTFQADPELAVAIFLNSLQHNKSDHL